MPSVDTGVELVEVSVVEVDLAVHEDAEVVARSDEQLPLHRAPRLPRIVAILVGEPVDRDPGVEHRPHRVAPAGLLVETAAAGVAEKCR